MRIPEEEQIYYRGENKALPQRLAGVAEAFHRHGGTDQMNSSAVISRMAKLFQEGGGETRACSKGSVFRHSSGTRVCRR
jgi:hypothetical protein